MPTKRICLVPTNAGDYDAVWNLTIDVVLNADGTASRRMTAFGVRGSLGNAPINLELFLLRPDGAVDFGTDYDDVEDRDARFNLRDAGRRVVVGELFTFTDGNEGEIIYRVTQVIDPE